MSDKPGRWRVPLVVWVALGVFGLAGLIALVAHRAGSLTRDGVLAATLVGSLAMLAGTAWGLYLVLWFVSASLVSRLGVHVKRQRTASVLPPREARDAWQEIERREAWQVASYGLGQHVGNSGRSHGEGRFHPAGTACHHP